MLRLIADTTVVHEKVADTTFVHEKVVSSVSVLSMVSLVMDARVVTHGHAALSSSRRAWHHSRPTKVADTTFVHEEVVGSASAPSMVSFGMSARGVTAASEIEQPPQKLN